MCLFMCGEVHLLATANDKITRRLHCPLSMLPCTTCARSMLVTKRWECIPPGSWIYSSAVLWQKRKCWWQKDGNVFLRRSLVTLCEVRDTCMNKVWHPFTSEVAQLPPHSSQFYSWRTTQQIAVTGSPNWLREGESDLGCKKNFTGQKHEGKLCHRCFASWMRVLWVLKIEPYDRRVDWRTGNILNVRTPYPWDKPRAMASKKEENIWGNSFANRWNKYGKICRDIDMISSVYVRTP